ncbi:OmpW/AlkL family protein [Acinetobacter shaoyimingii]|uniref:OmpW family protein n=1 Tax=Acinetobacter shaoyimingii TaxID=2715164 RepID=A0A6G8RX23_9GAMM|nr:OmpW family protein [Acinetobacter shaoyimingii]QIO06411.1 OmpW family protein [Acinetobacter shaoyimingii]
MKKTLLCLATTLALVPSLSQAKSPYFSLQDGENFKRFSVSVGALYVKPTGNAQPFRANTSIANGETAKVGTIKRETVLSNIDSERDPGSTAKLLQLVDNVNNYLPSNFQILDTLPSGMSGSAEIYGLDSWNNPGTGLEADDVTTLGIMTNYFFTDNISFEIKAGIPPKVDLKGKGQINAPFVATANPLVIPEQLRDDLNINLGGWINNFIDNLPNIPLESMYLKNSIPITNLEKYGAVASARAWTPAFEFQYHFGKTGVNKFRPYVGVGMMYAYFNELELNPGLKTDLVNAGHMIANIKNGQAGAALEKKDSGTDIKVKVDAGDAFAPVATAGFTYDFNDRWFAAGSVSYAHLTGDTTITVSNKENGQLIKSTADIEINPLLVYAGVGYRF